MPAFLSRTEKTGPEYEKSAPLMKRGALVRYTAAQLYASRVSGSHMTFEIVSCQDGESHVFRAVWIV